jgi:hypothetical protein
MSKRQPFKLAIEAEAEPEARQRRLAFVVPFTEARAIVMQRAERIEQARRECEQFEETFNEGEDDSNAD